MPGSFSGRLRVEPCLPVRSCAKETAIGVDRDSAQRSSPILQTNTSNYLKLLPRRRSSRSRTCGCSKNCRNVTRNCAKRWSIRQRQPRCSVSSADRRRTCSRSSTPSSRVPRGFVGSMTWCCDSARAIICVPRAHFGPIPMPDAVEISIDEPWFRWVREHGTLHIPDVTRAERISRRWVPPAAWRTLLVRSPSSAGGIHWRTGRTSYRGASLHPGADQVTRNICRPGGDRDRKRAAVPRAQGIA